MSISLMSDDSVQEVIDIFKWSGKSITCRLRLTCCQNKLGNFQAAVIQTCLVFCEWSCLNVVVILRYDLKATQWTKLWRRMTYCQINSQKYSLKNTLCKNTLHYTKIHQPKFMIQRIGILKLLVIAFRIYICLAKIVLISILILKPMIQRKKFSFSSRTKDWKKKFSISSKCMRLE